MCTRFSCRCSYGTCSTGPAVDFTKLSHSAHRGAGQGLRASIRDGGEPLIVSFGDSVGRIEAEAHLFEFDLRDFSAASAFGLRIEISNHPTGWATLDVELQLTEGRCGAVGSSPRSVFVSPDHAASFSSLAGGRSYCLVVPAGSGELRAQSSPAPPDFTATLTPR